MKTKYLIKGSLVALILGSSLITSCETNEAGVAPSPGAPNPGGTTNPNSGDATRTVVNASMNVPWEILWGPDNFIWTTERNGRISRINPENGQQSTIATLPNVTQVAEGGLLGMILHPNFTTQPYVYVAYTYTGNGSTALRVSRFTYVNNTLTQETSLLDNIPATATHFGGRLVIQNYST